MEDKLTPDQRIRLEALNQAVASTITASRYDTAFILERANKFEDFIRGQNMRDEK